LNHAWQIVEVQARFDAHGQVTPLSLVWEGRKLGISGGRRWQDTDGLHILVMGPDERVLELLFAPAEMKWYCKRPAGGINLA
jgi:hypothetical protein